MIPDKFHDLTGKNVTAKNKKKLQSVFTAKIIVPIISEAVGNKPGVSYQSLQEIIKPYALDKFITDNILQAAKELAKVELFGTDDDNVRYAKGVAAQLQELGHSVELLYSTQAKAKKKLLSLVVAEEVAKQKKNRVIMKQSQQSEYLEKWKSENAVYLAQTFGVEDGPPLSFLTGILFVTSCSKQMVPLLEDVVQADGAHTSYGKYTLFTAYGTSANGNMVLVAGAILFGNEDKVNWFKFWTFLKTHHPSLSCPKRRPY
jgi:hypothetical protein